MYSARRASLRAPRKGMSVLPFFRRYGPIENTTVNKPHSISIISAKAPPISSSPSGSLSQSGKKMTKSAKSCETTARCRQVTRPNFPHTTPGPAKLSCTAYAESSNPSCGCKCNGSSKYNGRVSAGDSVIFMTRSFQLNR